MIVATAVVYGADGIVHRDDTDCIERFLPGAFRESVEWIRRGDYHIRCDRNHCRRHRLGSTRDGSLRVVEDGEGVHFRLLGHLLPAGFTGCSFTFDLPEYKRVGNLFIVHRAVLTSLTICTSPERPVYPQTFPRARSLADPVVPVPPLEA